MPVYDYKGVTAAGKNVRGQREAGDPKVLRGALRKEGIFLTDVVEGKKGGKASPASGAGMRREVDLGKYFQRITTQEIAVVTRQLAVLLRAGIPLVDALAAIVEQTENEKFKAILGQVKDAVNEGSSLADAMRKHSVFGNLYVNMVRAGEASGALDVVLQRLADFTEKQAKLATKIKGTMAYPIVMVVVAVGIISVLFVVVIPKVTKIFDQTGQVLPIYTQILIAVSTFARDNWYVAIASIAGAVYFFIKWKASQAGRARWDALVLKLPLVGTLVRKIAISRFALTLSTLLKSGVPLLTALDIVKNVVTNHVISQALERARESIKEGESIAVPLKRSGQFYPIVTHMISIGERSGQLEEMLVNVSEAYDNEVDATIGALMSLLEPLMILGMGSVVAFIVFSILMPILQMNELIQ